MTAPDLPMRERIAEAICEHDGWYGVPGKGAYCDCEHFLAPDGAYAVNAWKAHRADAVLTVLADLPDTAVEAGARTLTAPEPIPGAKTLGCARHHRVIFNNGCPACNKEARAVLTATMTAIKEGKA